MNRLLASLMAAISAIVLVSAAAAEDWPTKPVRIVVPSAAGGANDLLARILADRLSNALAQQFFVDNRPGGGGIIAAEMVARVETDGYTLMTSGMPAHVLVPAINPKNTGYDPVRDFTHIAYFGGPPNMFVVHASSPVKSFAELLSAARDSNGGVEYVSPGVGSVGNMVAEYVAAKEKVKLIHVPYRGGGAAILDLVAGHVKVGSMTLATTVPYIRSGALRPIAVSSEKRLAEFPDVPTMVELGYPELVVTNWFGLSGPAGLSKDIVDKLNLEVNKAMQLPSVQNQLAQEWVQTRAMTPAEFTQFVEIEVVKWSLAVKTMNIAFQ